MDLIQKQASELWELIFSEETGATYQDALNLTGNILKETAQLLWLIICSVFVFGAWLGDTSMNAGNSVRSWIDNQGNPAVAADKKPIAETGKSLLETGRSGIAYLLDQAREQLGLEPAPPAPVRKASRPTPTPAAASSSESFTAADVSSPTPGAGVSPDPKPSAGAPTPGASVSQSTDSSPTEDTEISREADSGDWPPTEID